VHLRLALLRHTLVAWTHSRAAGRGGLGRSGWDDRRRRRSRGAPGGVRQAQVAEWMRSAKEALDALLQRRRRLADDAAVRETRRGRRRPELVDGGVAGCCDWWWEHFDWGGWYMIVM
jgi:hypothetical protein